ncbi:unnamed protein product, partial [Prunus brigantina]
LRAAERGHFVSKVPTSQKSWRNRRVLLSGNWESPSDRPVRFSVPTIFQIAGKVKQPTPSREDIQKVERVRTKVPAADRVYPDFLFTENLIGANLVDPAEMTPARQQSEMSKRRLLLGAKAKRQRRRILRPAKLLPGRADPEELRRDIIRKRPMFFDLEGPARTKRTRVPEQDRAIFVIEDDDEDEADSVNIACPPKAVQFANHMIVGSQMEPSEVTELPKKTLREKAGRAFLMVLQASMEMWLCMRRAINAAERAKKAYEDGRSKVADAGKVLQEHANLLKDKAALERQLAATEDKLDELRGALEASVAAAREAEAAKEAV